MRSDTFSLLALAALSAPVDAYWRMSCMGTLLKGRIDPVVSPNAVGGHTHHIIGGNGFAPNMTYESTQKSTCTSCTIKGDNSNYWVPMLYHRAKNGSFIDVPVSGGTIYYQQRVTYPGRKLTAFPEGFRMLVGDPERRTFDGSPAQRAAHFVCLGNDGPNGHNPDRDGPGFPKVNCPDGLRAELYMPSCWDGKNLDSPDHKSHMAYPKGDHYDSGECPDSHPVPMISLFYEFIFGINDFKDEWWDGNNPPWVFSSGDDSGLGMHGDFINGWKVETLQRGIDLKTTNDFGAVNDPTFQGIFEYPDSYGESCTLPPLVDEPITGVLPALPGCNPVHDGPIEKKDCGATKTLGVATGQIFTDVTKTLKWSYLGCGTDDNNARALPTRVANADTVTVDNCIEKCSNLGYTIAGLQFGRECWCGNSLSDKGKADPSVVGKCSTPCAGNSAQKCGAGGANSLYQKCSGTSCANIANFGLIGQVGPLGGGGGAAPAPVPVSSAPAPASTSVSKPATAISTKQVNVATSAPAPVKPAPTPVKSAAGSSPAKPTSAVTLPAGWQQQGCVIDPVSTRALQGITLAWWGEPITASNCAAYCAKKGFSISGVEYGEQCFCGNELKGGGQAAEGACNVPCKGNAKEICGGKGALSVSSSKSLVARRRRSVSA